MRSIIKDFPNAKCSFAFTLSKAVKKNHVKYISVSLGTFLHLLLIYFMKKVCGVKGFDPR